MKYFFATCWIGLLAGTLSAQTFFPIPGALLSQAVAFEQANECYIHFNNPSGDSLRLRWRLLERSLPDGWDADLCDYGLCYEGIPPNGTMNPIYDTIMPYLKLIVQPGSNAGAGWVWFRVYELGNSGNFQDVYFSVYTPGTLSLSSPEKNEGISVFPNPAKDVVYLSNPSSHPIQATFFNFQGQEVVLVDIAPQAQTAVDVAHWAKGLYWVKSGINIHYLFKH